CSLQWLTRERLSRVLVAGDCAPTGATKRHRHRASPAVMPFFAARRPPALATRDPLGAEAPLIQLPRSPGALSPARDGLNACTTFDTRSRGGGSAEDLRV